MGRLIPISSPNQKHAIDFEYVGAGKVQKCFMFCKCGFRVEIESFRKPWSLIESNVKFRKHMKEVGLERHE